MILKSNKVGKWFLQIILSIMLIDTVIALGLSVYNLISFNIDVCHYIYMSLGVVLLPFEFLFTGKVFLINKGNIAWYFTASFVFFLIVFITMVELLKYFSDMSSVKRKKVAKIITLIFSFIIIAIFGVACFVLTKNLKIISTTLNSISPEFIITLTSIFGGTNINVLLSIFSAYFNLFFMVISFILLLIFRKKHKIAEVKISENNTNLFYSVEYIQSEEKEQSSSEIQEIKPSKDLKEDDPNAKKLVEKIRMLDELRKEGKISNPEYIRLRQSAIRRYK